MNKSILIAFFSLLLFGSISGFSLPIVESQKDGIVTTESLQTLLQKYAEDNKVVGVAVGFIDHGAVQFFFYGNASMQGDPISEETLFEIGSITKVFTALALMDMVAKDEVKLDDAIEIHLPGIRIPEIENKKITLRHLATHHSGLPRMPNNFNPKNPSNPYVDYTIENLYDFLNHYDLQKAPEEQFEYSNLGMGLLGHILSLKAGESYEELIQKRICNLLDMRNTAITLTPEMQKRFATGHEDGKAMEHWDIPYLAGAGAIRSNVKDMTLFLAANMGLTDSPIETLLKQSHQKQFSISPTFEIGLGWLISPNTDAEVIWHNGATGGFRTFIGFNQKNQRGVVVLSNTTGSWIEEFAFGLLNQEP